MLSRPLVSWSVLGPPDPDVKIVCETQDKPIRDKFMNGETKTYLEKVFTRLKTYVKWLTRKGEKEK